MMYSIVASPSFAAWKRRSTESNLPRGCGRGSLQCSVSAMVTSAGTEVPVSRSAAAESFVRCARVLHAEAERRALLGCAEHVRRLDVDLLLAEPIRGPRE